MRYQLRTPTAEEPKFVFCFDQSTGSWADLNNSRRDENDLFDYPSRSYHDSIPPNFLQVDLLGDFGAICHISGFGMWSLSGSSKGMPASVSKYVGFDFEYDFAPR